MNLEDSYPLRDLIKNHKGNAIRGIKRDDLGYDDLRKVIAEVGRQLHYLGVYSGDTVAIVLPNGPDMATCFISVASHAIAAPLNPSFTESEYHFYLSDLSTKLLIVLEHDETPAREAALQLLIPVVEIRSGKKAGDFFLIDRESIVPMANNNVFNNKNDVALVLHTSGTTSKPKIVPLTSHNICISANNLCSSLALNKKDVCLNIMPLFHIHGLIAAVLGSLASGGSVICTSGFNGLLFFDWLKAFNPTWYTAVPTMHQTILSRIKRREKEIFEARLRFIRSSSASLPIPVLETLEAKFNCVVIEAYGMTEAAHQMTSNPMPPRRRRSGSVGIASGLEVRIMDNAFNFLPSNQHGEIVIRGENVTLGYKNNTKANEDSFVDGWFRTGDQGVFDDDGYLKITGRIKEIINRGGEKISPKEIDDAFIAHPSVAQAVTFSLPHEKLGEDLAVVVVLEAEEAEKSAKSDEILGFVKKRLAPFKVPKTLRIVDAIPKGPTGKIQRIGLAKRLGLVS